MDTPTYYHLLGQISVTFASIEHRLKELLEYLLIEKHAFVKPYLIDDFTLDKCIQKIRKVAQLRFLDKKTLGTLIEVLNSINSLRKERNWFIHGDWNFEELAGESSCVSFFIYKPQYNPKGGWEYIDHKQVTKKNLEKILSKAESAKKDLITLNEVIIKQKLL